MSVVVSATDDDLGLAARASAVEEARLRGLPLVLVSQVEMPAKEADSRHFGARHETLEKEVAATAAELEASAGITCQPFVPDGAATQVEAMLAAAEQTGADLVVVGLRRRSPVGKALLGSVAQEILLQADCPVLGVKTQQKH